MAAINIVKKLSMRVLAGDVKKAIKGLGEGASQIAIAKVVGIARGVKTGESNFGPWVALTGEFIAESLTGDKAGQRYRTGTLFLPDVALDLVTPLVGGLEKGSGVEIAFEIGAETDENSTVGYIYTAAFLLEPATNDPLEALMNKALPAPTTEPDAQGDADNGDTQGETPKKGK